jgi:hypothetical protein
LWSGRAPGRQTLCNAPGAWGVDEQELRIQLRDPGTDAVLATVFRTEDPLPSNTPAIAAFSADVSAFVGQLARVDVQVVTQYHCQWFQLDHFDVY